MTERFRKILAKLPPPSPEEVLAISRDCGGLLGLIPQTVFSSSPERGLYFIKMVLQALEPLGKISKHAKQHSKEVVDQCALEVIKLVETAINKEKLREGRKRKPEITLNGFLKSLEEDSEKINGLKKFSNIEEALHYFHQVDRNLIKKHSALLAALKRLDTIIKNNYQEHPLSKKKKRILKRKFPKFKGNNPSPAAPQKKFIKI